MSLHNAMVEFNGAKVRCVDAAHVAEGDDVQRLFLGRLYEVEAVVLMGHVPKDRAGRTDQVGLHLKGIKRCYPNPPYGAFRFQKVEQPRRPLIGG